MESVIVECKRGKQCFSALYIDDTLSIQSRQRNQGILVSKTMGDILRIKMREDRN